MPLRSLTRPLWLTVRILLVLAGCWYVASRITWVDMLIVRADAHSIVDSRLAGGGSFRCERIGEGQARVVLASGEVVTVSLPTGANSGLELRPGLRSTFAESDWRWLGIALLVSIPVFFIQASRWGRLLTVRSIELPFYQNLRMSLIGSFCNYFMLGSTGGDVVKACYVVQAAPQGKAAAVSTVVADRIVGLISLVGICAVGLASPVIQASPRIAWAVAASIVATAVGCLIVMAWSRMRHLQSLRSSPMLAPIRALLDHAVPFVHSPRVLGICLIQSVVSYLLFIFVYACCAQAVGFAGHWGVLAATIPVIAFAGSLPISYLGFGVMEPVAMTLLADPGFADPNQVVMFLLLGRLVLFIWSLSGAVFIATGQDAYAAETSAVPVDGEPAATTPARSVNP